MHFKTISEEEPHTTTTKYCYVVSPQKYWHNNNMSTNRITQ